MNPLLKKLTSHSLLLSDGAWGTMMQSMGLEPGECPESWNLKYPERIEAIAKAYIDAGADLVGTNSFGGSRFKLMHYGLQDQVTEINRAAASISRKAAGPDRFVMGSVGPTGKMLIMGDVTEDELYEAFKEQVIALEEGGADAVCIETMTALDEGLLAIRAAKENSSLVVIATMTFDKTVTGEFRTMMGVSPEEMTLVYTEAGVDILGTNCGNGMANMIPIVEAIRRVNPGIPVLVHANAGLPHYHEGKNVFDESPGVTASYVPRLLDAGANIVGGCCGTTPETIAEIRKKIEEAKHVTSNQ